MSCSAYFARLVKEFVCGKTGPENSLLKSKAWKWQLSLAHTLQTGTDFMITPCGIAFGGSDLDRTERVSVSSTL